MAEPEDAARCRLQQGKDASRLKDYMKDLKLLPHKRKRKDGAPSPSAPHLQGEQGQALRCMDMI